MQQLAIDNNITLNKKISMLEIGRKGGHAGLFKEIESLRKKESQIEI